MLSRWNEYLDILSSACFWSYENHNLTIQFTTVFFQKSTAGEKSLLIAVVSSLEFQRHNKQIDNRLAKLYD